MAGVIVSFADRDDEGRPAAGHAERPAACEEVLPLAGSTRLAGDLTIPENASSIVIFAHGSGSSRHSARNRHVARVLNDAGLGTLLFDLLTSAEEIDRGNVFDIGLLGGRLAAVTRMAARPAACGRHRDRLLRCQHRRGGVTVGGRGTRRGHRRRGVQGRPPGPCRVQAFRGDRAHPADRRRRRRGGARTQPAGKGRAALPERPRAVVPGAAHLFEEPGTLDAAARLARDWFTRHLG